MKESRKDFIKQGHKAACSEWKEKIEREFPELFKEDVKANGWYKDKGNEWCMFFEEGVIKYGVNMLGDWRGGLNTEYTIRDSDYKATDKEVEEALIKEANKRGFKRGVKFIKLGNGVVQTVNRLPYFQYGRVAVESPETEWSMVYKGGSSNPSIFENGQWATIVETITKEQAEKELGKTILN
jgi:hypothetical protein